MSSIAVWSQLITDDVEPTEHLKLVLSLVWVVRFVYSRHTINALTMAQYSSSAKSHTLHQRLMVAVMKSCSNGYMLQAEDPLFAPKDFYLHSQRVDIDGGIREQVVWPNKFISRNEAIWFIDSLRAYFAMERDLLDAANNYLRNGYFCIVYTGLEPERMSNVHRIFQHLFALYVTNVNVFLADKPAPYVYTYFPYSGRLCHQAEPQLLFSFGNISPKLDAFRFPHDFFPSKVENMHGCELHATVVEIPPFIQVDRNESTGAVKRLHGIEGLVIKVIAERMNFKLNVDVTSNRGFVHRNGSSTGASQEVIEGRSNMTIGIYMYDERRGKYMLPTFSYMTSPLLIGVSPGHQLTPMQRLAKPFRWKIWTVLGVTVLLTALTIVLLRLLHRAALTQLVFGRVPFTNLVYTMLGGNLQGSSIPRGNYARYLLMFWMWYTVILRNAYQGELFIMLQDARALSGVSNLREAVALNYTFYCTYTVARIMRHTVPGARIKPINTLFTTPNLIKRLQAGEQKMALPLLLQTVRLANHRIRRTGHRIDTLPDKFLTVTATFYLRRHSFLLHQFDMLLQRINSAGLISQFESRYVDREMDKLRRQQAPSKLSIWLLGGAFSLYVALLTLSSLIFLLERLSLHLPALAYMLQLLNI